MRQCCIGLFHQCALDGEGGLNLFPGITKLMETQVLGKLQGLPGSVVVLLYAAVYDFISDINISKMIIYMSMS